MVGVARAAPVGRRALVALMLTLMDADGPEQPLQNNSTSSFVSVPETVGENVSPHQAVVDMALPEVLPSATERSSCSPPPWASFTSPGLTEMSALVPVPVEKSPNVVSVKQAFGVSAVSERFWIVVAPPVTTTPDAEAVV